VAWRLKHAVRILVGHMMDKLREFPDESEHCCVTSPLYYGLRSYGTKPQIWGGDPNFHHEFGQARPNKPNQERERPDLPKPPPSWGVRDACMSTIGGGAFCHCGAWRGDIGLAYSGIIHPAHARGASGAPQ
jgi:hypothetical protein